MGHIDSNLRGDCDVGRDGIELKALAFAVSAYSSGLLPSCDDAWLACQTLSAAMQLLRDSELGYV